MQNDEVKYEIDKLNITVDMFGSILKRKLFHNANSGWKGWDDIKNKEAIEERLRKNIDEGFCNKNLINIAILSMMLYFIQAGLWGQQPENQKEEACQQ